MVRKPVRELLKSLLGRSPAVYDLIKTAVNSLISSRDQYIYNEYLKQITESNVVSDLKYSPLISIITPTYNTPEKFLREMIESVIDQTYSNWELILVDDASTDDRVRRVIEEYADSDKRIIYKFLTKNHHIAGATNEALKISNGEFVALFDHDDVLLPNAISEVVRTLNDNQNLDFIYTDEDKLINNKRTQPFIKPGWNRDFLYSVNYITHLAVIRKSLLEEVGGEDKNYNGAQDWELFLRLTSKLSPDKIHHIPKILYNWRVHESSTARLLDAKPYVIKSQHDAIEKDLKANGLANFKLNRDELYGGQWQLTFELETKPKVSVFIDESNRDDLVEYIKDTTEYDNYECLRLTQNMTYDEILNQAGDYIVFITDESKPETNWINVMLGDASRSDIGFVLGELTHEEDVLRQINDLVGIEEAVLIAKLSHINTSKHLYFTTRYNIEVIYKGVFMIETKKLKSLVSVSDKFNSIDASKLVVADMKRNLYNPYIKMIK